MIMSIDQIMNIYKTSLSSCLAYLPMGHGITTLHHNPLVGWGRGGVPQGGKVKHESLAWFPLKGSVQAFSKSLSFTPKELFSVSVFFFSDFTSVSIKSQSRYLQVDLALT